MKADVLFYGSAALTALSFLLFAYQVVIYVWRTRPRPPQPLPEPQEGVAPNQQAVQQAIQGIQQTVQQLSGLADAFSKAGPMATSAVLCILFALICLIGSGIIKVAI